MASRKWSIYPPQRGGGLSRSARKHLDEFAESHMNEAHENTVRFLEKKIQRQKVQIGNLAEEIEVLSAEVESLGRDA
jgi:hypothetical protein